MYKNVFFRIEYIIHKDKPFINGIKEGLFSVNFLINLVRLSQSTLFMYLDLQNYFR
jgi:hypothetical protein